MENKPIINLVGWLLLFSALGFFLYGIGYAIYLSWDGNVEKEYAPALEGIIASLQALLLTNLGMLLGISVANPQSGIAQQLLLGRPAKGVEAQKLDLPDPLSLREKIQLFGLVVYVVSLIVCVVTWAVNDFPSGLSNDTTTTTKREVLPLIAASGKIFFGVALAYLTLVLTTKPAQGQ